jgi:hypothetical protein
MNARHGCWTRRKAAVPVNDAITAGKDKACQKSRQCCTALAFAGCHRYALLNGG